MTASAAALESAIRQLEAQRALLGDAAVDAAVAALRAQLDSLIPPAPKGEAGRGAEAAAERKFVTILFADLSGFTALAETLDPEAVRSLMNACFDRLTPAITRYGGFIDKFIGDEIMALFGAPQAHENDPERALRAALDLHQALAEFACENRLEVGLHIGVNTGLVVAGGIGSADRQGYSVMGDAVNLAARMTEYGEAGQTLCGPLTRQLAAPLFEFTPLPPVTLKGKREPQAVFRLDELKAIPGALRGLEPLGLRAPLVGRDAERARALAALERLRHGAGGMLLISGEAGVGKSRLAAELRRSATAGPLPVAWYEGRCLSYGELLPYHLFLDLLRALMAAPPEADAAQLQAALQRLLGDLLPARAESDYSYLADLLSLPLPAAEQERLGRLTGESRRWQIFNITAELLAALARRSPCVIVLEDLHWADPTSLDLLDHLVATLPPGLPLLFLFLSRPYHGAFYNQRLGRLRDPAGSLRGEGLELSEIVLSPLSSADSQALVEYLLDIEDLPDADRRLILQRAEGNPLFIEEILRSLISQNLLVRRGERWGLAAGIRLHEIEIPSTLQGVIAARLDRLESDARLVLQMAAVIGRIFWHRVLDYLNRVEQALASGEAVNEALLHLEQVELIRQTRSQPEVEFIFKHVLVQEAAYSTLLLEQRRRFHRRVAEALEQLAHSGAPLLEDQHGLLAYHYEAAGEVEAALRCLRLAGDRARLAYSLPEAEGYYRRAINLLSQTDPRRAQFLLDLGLTALTRGDFPAANEYCAAGFALRRSLPAQPLLLSERTLRLNPHHFRPPDMNPTHTIDVFAWNVLGQGLVGLIELDENMNVIPQMAERWEVDPDGLRYRFYLRPDARWSDGAPLTAHDFIYAWERILDPEQHSPLLFFFAPIRGAELGSDPAGRGWRALDDLTLEIELSQPLACFLQLMKAPAFVPLPRHAWPPENWSTSGEGMENMIVNGPFLFLGWQDNCLRLRRNPRYTGPADGNVDQVELSFLSPADSLAAFLRGELDMVGLQYGQDLAPLQTLLETGGEVRHLRVPMLQTMYLGLWPVGPLADLRLRRALTLVQNRRLLQASFDPQQAIFARGGFVPPGLAGHTPEMPYPYDPAQARALMREAGYAVPGFPAGKTLPIQRMYSALPAEAPVMVELLRAWREELGVQVDYIQTGLFQLMEARTNDEAPPNIFSVNWVADYPDSYNFLSEGYFQVGLFDDPHYMETLQRARTTLDSQQRMAIYHELDRLLTLEHCLVYPLNYAVYRGLLQPWIRSFPLLATMRWELRNVML